MRDDAFDVRIAGVGSTGISGGSVAQDIEVAEAGIAAFKEQTQK